MAKNLHDQMENISCSFCDFPEDVQLSILSLLTPAEIASFACTSKRFVSLCRNDAKLWFSLCDRRWGSRTHIRKWGSGRITFKQLYKTLIEYENLIGFWRRSGNGNKSHPAINSPPPLVVFEWGQFFISGSRVSPSKSGTYNVIKEPFLWLSIAPTGEEVSFIDPKYGFDFSEDFLNSSELGFLENELVPVNVNFMGKCHVVVEENLRFAFSNSPEGKKNGCRKVWSSGYMKGEDYGSAKDVSRSPGSERSQLMSEIYQYFANRTSPVGDRSLRRQRKREKERQGERKWEPDHFVKIVNCSPTPSRPLQGLWKGICEDMNLDFYLVVYDDIGGIACRRVGDPSKPFSSYAPVFWTSDTTFIESPFSPEEEHICASRVHLRPPVTEADCGGHRSSTCTDCEVVSRILCINSSYDLVIPDLAETSVNRRQVEGRIWMYRNGTFGFGFLRDNHVVDLRLIAQNGRLVDNTELL